jgi:hypothetical protein
VTSHCSSDLGPGVCGRCACFWQVHATSAVRHLLPPAWVMYCGVVTRALAGVVQEALWPGTYCVPSRVSIWDP